MKAGFACRNRVAAAVGPACFPREPGQPALAPVAESGRQRCRLRRGRGEAAERVREIGLFCLHDVEHVLQQRSVAGFGGLQPQLVPETLQPVLVMARGNSVHDRGGLLDRYVDVRIDQRQQRFGQPCEVPLQDRRLIAIGVAATTIDEAVDGGWIVVIHEGAGPEIDRLAGDRHVVRVHHAVDEAELHPARDERALPIGHRLQQPQVAVRCH